jgi:hypothetical protein
VRAGKRRRRRLRRASQGSCSWGLNPSRFPALVAPAGRLGFRMRTGTVPREWGEEGIQDLYRQDIRSDCLRRPGPAKTKCRPIGISMKTSCASRLHSSLWGFKRTSYVCSFAIRTDRVLENSIIQ